jgi:hypothetical protein
MMAIGSILLGLALLIVVALYLARPLLTAQPQAAISVTGRQQLEQEKESYLDEIRALDFDYETGTIPTDVYEQQRAQLLDDAAAVLKALDELPEAGDDAYSQIEEAVAVRRHQHAISSNGQSGYCTQCGQPLDAGDKFCARCGQPQQVAQPTQ